MRSTSYAEKKKQPPSSLSRPILNKFLPDAIGAGMAERDCSESVRRNLSAPIAWKETYGNFKVLADAFRRRYLIHQHKKRQPVRSPCVCPISCPLVTQTASRYRFIEIAACVGFCLSSSLFGGEAKKPGDRGIGANAVFQVTNADDLGAGSLRNALADAAALPGADVITFSPSVFNALFNTIELYSELTVDDPAGVTIDASALQAGLTLDGAMVSRLIKVKPGSSLTLKGLTLTGGDGSGVEFGSGGAIYNSGTLTLVRCNITANSAFFDGGAIYSVGTLTLTDCRLAGNSAFYDGGAINSDGALTLTRCTLSDNFSEDGDGGAIFNLAASATLTHCTVVGNFTTQGSGGAIADHFGTLTLKHCTIVGSHCDTTKTGYGGGGVHTFSPEAAATITNTIVAANSSASGIGPDLWREHGTLLVTNSLISDGANSGVVDGVNGNSVGLDPLLAPLGDYGGPTPTMALLPYSPARDAATALVPAISSDQRGFSIVGPPDIGAYEAGTLANYASYIWEALPPESIATEHAATFDYDGDGADNFSEWLALTNAADPASKMRFTQFVRTGNFLSIAFPSAIGRTYSVENSSDLESWNALTTLPGTNQPISLVVGPVNSLPKYFLRLRVGP